jgi:hypothetical protein
MRHHHLDLNANAIRRTGKQRQKSPVASRTAALPPAIYGLAGGSTTTWQGCGLTVTWISVQRVLGSASSVSAFVSAALEARVREDSLAGLRYQT